MISSTVEGSCSLIAVAYSSSRPSSMSTSQSCPTAFLRASNASPSASEPSTALAASTTALIKPTKCSSLTWSITAWISATVTRVFSSNSSKIAARYSSAKWSSTFLNASLPLTFWSFRITAISSPSSALKTAWTALTASKRSRSASLAALLSSTEISFKKAVASVVSASHGLASSFATSFSATSRLTWLIIAWSSSIVLTPPLRAGR